MQIAHYHCEEKHTRRLTTGGIIQADTLHR
jgi:hypothetical protein